MRAPVAVEQTISLAAMDVEQANVNPVWPKEFCGGQESRSN
jgi:hypothetical protein